MTRKSEHLGRNALKPPNDDLCEVCREREAPGVCGQAGIRMCRPCDRSYDRCSGNTPGELIRWAASRARKFERALHRRIRKTLDTFYAEEAEKAYEAGRQSVLRRGR